MRVVVLPDPDAVAGAAAERFVSVAETAVAERGRFVAVLAGGSTPRRLYGLLASPGFRDAVPWDHATILFGDERCVGPDDPASNYRMAKETLLDHVPVPRDQVYRMAGEGDPEQAAATYEAILRDLYLGEKTPRFDLALLGMGGDGHTASLFPGTAALDETSRWVVANRVPALETTRITLTYPALNAARRILFTVTGGGKAGVFTEVFERRDPRYPAARIEPVDGTGEVLADSEAAGRF
jgi:6-phosphogluconolactonase